MKEKVIQFCLNNWNDILSAILSIAALATAIYANYRVNIIRQQEMQEPLYKDLQKLLKYKCDYFSSEQTVMGCCVDVARINKDEEDAIKRKVSRYFGTDEYNQLCTILDLCKKAEHINFDLGILFDLIKDGEPEKYSQLRDVLFSESSPHISEEEHEKNQQYLSTISIQYYKFSEEDPGNAYDYLELNAELESLNTEIKKKIDILDNKLTGIMMKR